MLKYSVFKDANVYSVARFQPAGYYYTPLPFFAARDVDGNKLKLRGQKDPIYNYIKKLQEYYQSVKGDIDEWVQSLNTNDTNILCCWCPHASHSKEQLRIYNTFICHVGLVGRAIENRRHDIDIYMDYDHCMYLDNRFKPNTYQLLRM